MRGGCLRFQAQYLRRIRLPLWSSIQPAWQKKLSDDSQPVEPLLAKIYRLEADDLSHLQS
jgi:hypothetical protein